MRRSPIGFIALWVLLVFGGLLVAHHVHAQNQTVSLGSNGFSCAVPVSTATTLQTFSAPCVAPGANVRLYITDIQFSASASGIAADSFPTLKSGTGGCASNLAVIWTAFTPAAVQTSVVQQFTTPIKLPLNSDVCWIESTAGSKTVTINGYIGP